jgi:AcrR family transcriptional regulator
MEHEKEDRRLRRTRQLLCDAFLALLQEKRYEAITVQDIVDRADVARSTFYAHYAGKDDLLVGPWGVFAGNLDRHRALKAQEDQASHLILSTRAWFYHIQAQDPILKTIVKGPAMTLAMRTLSKMLYQDIQHQLQPHLPEAKNGTIPPPVIIDYLANTLMTLIKWWITQGMPYTPERMDEIYQQLVMPGLASVLDQGEYKVTGR